jgi:hypothetical protein
VPLRLLRRPRLLFEARLSGKWVSWQVRTSKTCASLRPRAVLDFEIQEKGYVLRKKNMLRSYGGRGAFGNSRACTGMRALWWPGPTMYSTGLGDGAGRGSWCRLWLGLADGPDDDGRSSKDGGTDGVGLQVLGEAALVRCPERAVHAREWLLARVLPEVRGEGALLRSRKRAQRAGKRLLPGVGSDVPGEVRLGDGLVGALIAGKRLLPGVGTEVRGEVTLGCCRERAVLAGKRLLSGVGPEVRGEVKLGVSSVGAVDAGVRLLSVGSDVRGESALRDGLVVALLARKRLLPRVGPEVGRECALGGCRVGTVGTRKRLFPRVGAEVRLEVLVARSRKRAVDTRKWLLPRVRSEVPRKGVLACRLVVTLTAGMNHRICSKHRRGGRELVC